MNKKKQKPSGLKRLIVLVILIAVCAFTVVLVRGGFDLSGIRSVLPGSSTEEFFYENAGDSVFAELDGGLARAGASGLDYIDRDGNQTKIVSFSTSQPVLSSTGDRAVLYDAGGKKVCVFDKDGVIAEIEAKIAVISASLNDDGWLAVCEQESGYNGAVRVYNDDGAPVYEWYSGSGYVLAAAVSPDCRTLAVLTVAKAGSEIVFLPLDSTEEQGRYLAADTLLIDLCFMDNDSAAAISSGEWILVGSRGELEASHSFDGKYLSQFSMMNGSTAAIVLNDYQVGSNMEIWALTADGELTGKLQTERTINDISAHGRHISVLYSDGVSIYNSEMAEKSAVNEQTETGEIFTRADGSAVAVGTYSAKIYYR